MSHITETELSITGNLSIEQKRNAALTIAEAIKVKNNKVEKIFDYHLHYLLEGSDRGFPPVEYEIFIKDLLLMTLKPENAKEIYEKHGALTPKLFDNLIDFFAGLYRQEYNSWIEYNNITQWVFDLEDEEIYRLWRKYVNGNQKRNI